MKKWMGWLVLALEAAIPAELLHILLIAAGVILFALLLLALLRGAGKLTPVQKGIQVCYLAAAALVVWFLAVNTRQTCSYYYFVSPLMLLALLSRLAGALRGRGDSKGPMIIMLLAFVGIRQVYLFVVTRFVANTPFLVGFGYPVGWTTCCIIEVTYFFLRWRKPARK